MCGGMNARIQAKLGTDGDAVGLSTFDKHNTTFHREPDSVLDNRARFIAFCTENKLIISNTHFNKPPHKLATYLERKGHKGGPPFNRNI